MKILKTLALTALLTTVTMAQKEALLVGVDDYKGTESDFGKGISKDIANMKSLFEKWGFHVTVLYNKDSMKLREHLASYSSLGSDDSFAFYYSGHGSTQFDVSGDESDKKDESIVLSDGIRNDNFIDDAINGYLNEIPAKKLVLFDSCHSGTAFKRFGDAPMPKSMNSDKIDGVINTKAFRPKDSQLHAGKYIFLSASQDHEVSLATSGGSLFTNAVYKQFSTQNGLNTKLDELTRKIEVDIRNSCSSQSKPHKPKLSTSSSDLRFSTIGEFLKPTRVVQAPISRPTPTPAPRAEKSITLMGQPAFQEGDLLDFKIDTNGNSGYLTVFSIENGEPYIMYQSSKPKRGVFNFKKDFNIKPPIECYKSCTNCQIEKSMVYVAFSAQPIKIAINSQSKAIESQPAINTKGFREQKVRSFRTVIESFETTIY